ncbi:MAG: ABC transporter ATP-binding protein [Spirochaetota bacterium]|nr:ABC transporter ATP-binding protein [Spirochaetota bacterium]
MKSFFKILKFVLPYKFILITAIVFSILFSVFNAVTLYSIVPIFDTMTGEADRGYRISDEERILSQKHNLTFLERLRVIIIEVKFYINSYLNTKTKKEIITLFALLIVPLLFIKNLSDFIGRSLFAYAGNRVVKNIRIELFSQIIKLPYKYFHKSRSGELLSRITLDVLPLSIAVSSEIYNLISGFILLIINITILSLIDWRLIFFTLLLAGLTSLPIRYFGNLVKKITVLIQENFADISSKLQETISGIKVIKSFSMEGYEENKYKEINDSLFKNDLRRRVYQNLNPSFVELIGTIVAITLFIFGGYQIIKGELTSGEFIFFILIIINLFDPIKMISNSINNIKAGEAASIRISEILKLPVEDFYIGVNGHFNQSIQLKEISFKYDEEYALNKITISISKGENVALAGASGSGKSTILNMIASLYSPTTGEILIDNLNQQGLSLNWIRGKIAFVTQEVFLFNGTVKENITCGMDYDMERIIEASSISHAHEFISKLPKGYNTIVGERGMLLSGGERQRISIARAILNDPEILLFDEATSALDSESEKLIQDSLEYLFKTRTCVIVSHRLSTIKDADIIYLIDKGEIIDAGSHDELISRSDTYKRLFENPNQV